MKRAVELLVLLSLLLTVDLTEARDRLSASSAGAAKSAIEQQSLRLCVGSDLPGNWRLVQFGAPRRFKNSQAPYLFPHQTFQYSVEGSMRSVHSRQPIPDRLDRLFASVPSALSYRIDGAGRVVLTVDGQRTAVETWSCLVVSRGGYDQTQEMALQQGDLVMTLHGSQGQPLFVRQLRRV
ncbi:hypothetical protein FBQ96_03495 [Nitrospirales bacterium NOB]|nr:hypothetical protein [Nitrospirales bacterium NOB]